MPEKPIVVLINGLHAKSGGGVTYLRNILSELVQDRRLEFHLFLHVDQYELFGEAPEGLRLHLLEFKTSFLRLLMWEQLALPVLAREMFADVTFSPANYGPFFAPNPVILLRNSLAVVQREKRLSKRIYWAMLALATVVSLITARRAIAVSDYARKSLSFGLPRWVIDRIAIIPHGVATHFTPDPSIPRQDGVLLAVCDIYVQKNLHTLINAMEVLRKQHPSARLLVAGRIIDPDYHAELIQLIQNRHLNDAVEFLGGCTPSELLHLYRTCTLFVFPSTIETFGNPLVEAMACGAPIASSSSSAMPEVVGDAALLFDPLNVQQMAAVLAGLLDDPAARLELAAKGVKRAGDYSWEKTAKQTADILYQAAGRS